MPVLPLDDTDPFSATLGLMLFPGAEKAERRNAQRCAAKITGSAIEQYDISGEVAQYLSPRRIALQWATASGCLPDIGKRLFAGSLAGELLKVYFCLSYQDPALASFESAIKVLNCATGRGRTMTSRSVCWYTLRQFKSVVHLWAAWTIRGREFLTDVNAGYDGWTDFQFFLAEAEILRDWGQNWRPKRAKAKPPLGENLWRVPDGWRPPQQQPDWPNTGIIPLMTLPDDLIAGLKPAGRPPQAA